MAITVTDFLTLALAEIRVARAGDVINPDDAATALQVFNELLEALNIDERAIYTSQFPTFTITPNLQPHTIGLATNVPTPTWTTNIARPSRVVAANLLISTSVRQPLTLRDEAWWMDVRNRTVTTTIPTDLFYAPDWPNGSVYLWPVPSTAYTVELDILTLLAQVASSDTLDLPPGYQQLLRLTLAELLAPLFGQSIPATTAKNARDARARVWGNNDEIPRLDTRDAGMPGGMGGAYDYMTGTVRGR